MAMCRYLVADGRHCSEEAGEHDLCHWHDPHHTHQEAHSAEELEQYVRAGGLCHGLQLSRANLAGLNLVNKESDQGFLLEQCNLYRANLRGGHLYGLRMKGGSLMKPISVMPTSSAPPSMTSTCSASAGTTPGSTTCRPANG